MATIKIKLRPSATQGSEGTLFFQVIHRRVTRTVSTDYHVNTDEWDDALSAVRMGGSPGRQAYLQMVASKIRWNMKQFTAILVEKETAGVQYTADDVVELTGGCRPARRGSASYAPWPTGKSWPGGMAQPRHTVTP